MYLSKSGNLSVIIHSFLPFFKPVSFFPSQSKHYFLLDLVLKYRVALGAKPKIVKREYFKVD